jgi:hypothetical protein
MPGPRKSAERWLRPAAAGVAAVLVGVGAAELTAALVDANASPITAIGAALIDLSPPWAKELAIQLFGTADKLVLVLGIGLVLLVVAAAVGVLEHRRPPLGRVVIVIGGVAGAIAAVTRANPSLFSLLPVAAAVAVSMVALMLLLRRLREAESADAAASDEGALPSEDETGTAPDAAPSRRRFLAWVGGTAAIGALAVAGGYALQAGARAATAIRTTFTLPTPSTMAPPIPAGAELDVPGITRLVTLNEHFYRIDTALVVPQIDP